MKDNDARSDAGRIEAEALVAEVAWTMGLAGRQLTAEAIEALVRKTVAEKLGEG